MPFDPRRVQRKCHGHAHRSAAKDKSNQEKATDPHMNVTGSGCQGSCSEMDFQLQQLAPKKRMSKMRKQAKAEYKERQSEARGLRQERDKLVDEIQALKLHIREAKKEALLMPVLPVLVKVEGDEEDEEQDSNQ